MKKSKDIPNGIELLDSQIYKAPIWKTIYISKKNTMLKLIVAYILSLFFYYNNLFEDYSIAIAYVFIEILHYNYINTDINKP